MWGVEGGSPIFFGGWNPNFFVSYESMQSFGNLRQPLLGELAMSWREEREIERKNAIYTHR